MSNTVVILVNYNGAIDTAACIKSLLESQRRPGLIVVDTTPNDPELEREVRRYPKAELIRAPKNIGFGRGVNLGLRRALDKRFKYVFILNNDARVEPATISVLEMSMENHPNVGVIAPRILLLHQPDVLWYGGGEIDWFRGGARVPGVLGPADSPIAMEAREVSFASGCAMLVRSDVIRQIGGFDPRFFMYEEDLEYCLRVIENDYVIRYEPEAVVLHRWQGSLRGDDEEPVGIWSPNNPRLSFYAFHIVRNRLLNMSIHAKGKRSVMFACGFTLLIGWKALIFLKRGHFSGFYAICRGVRSYLQGKGEKFVDELRVGSDGE